ncbi:MAG: Rpn family recombination-promoting nuclease/putative transposase [Allobaculum sp.]|nr:Rpn family recombination-promoting nuclease/putative transposase [Allobaculum sp.]
MIKEPTILSQLLSITDHISHYDASAKRLLSHKLILAFILKACIPVYKDISIEDIAQKYIEGPPQISSVPVFPDQEGALIKGQATEDTTLYEGTRHYDIHFRASIPGLKEPIPILVNIENQISLSPGYPLIIRAVYYGARMISSQYGKEFTSSHYEKIKPVYTIGSFLNLQKRLKTV